LFSFTDTTNQAGEFRTFFVGKVVGTAVGMAADSLNGANVLNYGKELKVSGQPLTLASGPERPRIGGFLPASLVHEKATLTTDSDGHLYFVTRQG
jgi:hypothetical protein